MDKTNVEKPVNDVTAAIMTLHKCGLLDWETVEGAAQAELTIIVDEADDEQGNPIQFIRISRADPPDFASSDGEEIAEDFPIDSATYDLLVSGIPDLYEK